MGRGKLHMQLISNEKARRKGFEKRKKGLEKAAQELSTLCGVDIVMIVCGPTQGKDSDEPTIWPRNQDVVKGLIESYKMRLGYDGRNKTYNLSDFFKDQTEKVEGELKKLRENMRVVKYPMLDYDKYNCTSLDELKQFHGGLMAKIDAVRGRINLMKGSTSLFTEPDVLMNYSVQESGVFAPSMWKYDQPDTVQVQQPQKLGYYYDSQANMDNQMMMMNNGAFCRQGMYSFDKNYGLETGITENVGVSNDMYRFDENLSNYAYGFDGNGVPFQDCGSGTGMMEKVINTEPLMSYNVQNVQPLGSYFVPNVVPMPWNEQIPMAVECFSSNAGCSGQRFCPEAWFLNEES